MTINNIYINERCCEMRQIAQALQVSMRDGKLDELERQVSRINRISDELVNRIHDITADLQIGGKS